MNYYLRVILVLVCLVSILGTNIAEAWNAIFFSDELGCGDTTASANSTSLEYSGPDTGDILIPQLMACIDLGGAIEDPLVNCAAYVPAGRAGASECEGHGGFVGMAVTVTNMLYCLAWEQPGCIGDVYYTWTPDNETQADGCHPGLRVRSFICLQ
ncbi:hypothetical protein NUW58_g4746 [Xylaria curta]|uniref:Uncharacterized protein n=1 Tax=Xylaria curta TaxID=42375 RepID=A0ACC1P7S1_9PEZI|nr:hypothetical protein NUW58_g4746 [Xylaria curta]